jgi:hypothetical protein
VHSFCWRPPRLVSWLMQCRILLGRLRGPRTRSLRHLRLGSSRRQSRTARVGRVHVPLIFICTAYRRALALFIVLTLLIGIYVRAQHTLQRAGGRRATGSARRAEKCRAADAPTQLASKLGAARTGFSTNTSTRVRATARDLYTERRFLPPKCANRSCTLQNFTVN